MQLFRKTDRDNAIRVGWGVRVMLLTADSEDPLATRIAGLGGLVETEGEQFAALSAVIDDPVGYGLFVMDCDSLGGLQAGRRAFAMLAATGSRVPVILVSADCARPSFPDDRSAPIEIRASASPVPMRVAVEHALRGRLIWRAA